RCEGELPLPLVMLDLRYRNKMARGDEDEPTRDRYAPRPGTRRARRPSRAATAPAPGAVDHARGPVLRRWARVGSRSGKRRAQRLSPEEYRDRTPGELLDDSSRRSRGGLYLCEGDRGWVQGNRLRFRSRSRCLAGALTALRPHEGQPFRKAAGICPDGQGGVDLEDRRPRWVQRKGLRRVVQLLSAVGIFIRRTALSCTEFPGQRSPDHSL